MEIQFYRHILDNHNKLTQTSQQNPLRWMCLKHLQEESFTHTTPWFRCKDYFNDAVVWFHKMEKFSIYGMSSSNFHFNEDGSMYVAVSNIIPQFQANLALLDKIEAGMGCTVTVVGKTSETLLPETHWGLVEKSDGVTILHFSKECFLSTFRISMVTWLIRMANVDTVYTTYGDLFLPKNRGHIDLASNFTTPIKAKLPLLEFDKLDERGFLWYYSDIQHSDNGEKITSYNGCTVHNCGANLWLSTGVFG